MVHQPSCHGKFPLRTAIILVLLLSLLLFAATPAFAADAANQAANTTMGMSPILFVLLFFTVCVGIGVVAVLGGVGGGVVFTPLIMGFTPIDSYIVRATGLFIAMTGSLVAARPFLSRGLANMKLLLFTGVPYSISAVTGALLAGYVKAATGETGDAVIRLALGGLVTGLALLVILGGKRVEYPEVKKIDRFTQALGLSMSYYEGSLGKTVDYNLSRAPIAALMFCGVGLISGLFGLGAGWAIVPVFNMVMFAPLKVAAASSSVLIGIGDTGAIWPYITAGGIFALFAVPCMLGQVIGTTIGARLMLKVKAKFTRWIVIILMFGAGGKLLYDGISRLFLT